MGARRDGLEEGGGEAVVEHRGLVDDEEIGGEGRGFVRNEAAAGGVVFEQAVNRRREAAGGLREALCGAARRRGEVDADFLGFEDFDEGAEDRGVVSNEIVVGNVEAGRRVDGNADALGGAGGLDRGEAEAMAETDAGFGADRAADFARKGEECRGFGMLEEYGVGGQAGALFAKMGVDGMLDGPSRRDAAEGPGELLEIVGKAGTGSREGNDAEAVHGAVGVEEAAEEFEALGGGRG